MTEDKISTRINLKIDGREVEVEAGATVLEAARKLGVPIPTLCFVEGLEPSSSCFLCTVELPGRKHLLPACSLPAEEGMTVLTFSDRVRASRKMALELLLSDHAGDCVAPCSAQCPADLDISGFIHEAAAGRLDSSLEVLYRRLALPGSLGRICPRLCEGFCRRGDFDEGLAIGALHRYVVDHQTDTGKRPAARPLQGPSVGIVGAGPAGLSAAFYLLQKGHPCTLYEANVRSGGMLRYGIPAYRLPRQALDDEVAVIEGLGAVFHHGQRWGRDFRLQELQKRHGAVFLAVGAQLAMGLGCEGQELALSGISYLHQVASGSPPSLGSRVVVVGGGNTAMDAARTALRLGSQVKVIYRRTRNEMPCLLHEVDEAEKEGVQVTYLSAPSRLEADSNGSLLLTCQPMILGGEDDSGRRSPVPSGAAQKLECDGVVAAIGQRVDLALAQEEGLETTAWGLATHEQTLETNIPGVFAGGDAVLGADLAVRAVAAGRWAAESIHQLLQGRPVEGPKKTFNISLNYVDDQERAAMLRDIERAPRAAMPELALEERRTSFSEVELGLEDHAVQKESRRCLACGCAKAEGCRVRRLAADYQADANRYGGERRRFAVDDSHPDVVYEPGKCIACEACVRVAREGGEAIGLAIIGRGFQVAAGIPLDGPLAEALTSTARRCAEVCPSGALSLRTQRSCGLAPGAASAPLIQITTRTDGEE